MLNPRELPPQVVADFQRAVEVVAKRPRGTLVVKGPADAQVALDGGALMPIAGGVTFRDLLYGEHLIRVEQIGYAPWGTVVPFGQPRWRWTSRRARRWRSTTRRRRRTPGGWARASRWSPMPKGGPGAPLELALVDTRSGARRDAALVPTVGEAGQIDAAVMRLDEEARRVGARAAAGPGRRAAAGRDRARAAIAGAAAPADAGADQGDGSATIRPPGRATTGRSLTAIGVVAATALILSADRLQRPIADTDI